LTTFHNYQVRRWIRLRLARVWVVDGIGTRRRWHKSKYSPEGKLFSSIRSRSPRSRRIQSDAEIFCVDQESAVQVELEAQPAHLQGFLLREKWQWEITQGKQFRYWSSWLLQTQIDHLNSTMWTSS
jgi:hypothetical protein